VHGTNQQWFTHDGPGETPPLNVIFESRRGELHIGTPRGLYNLDSDSLVAALLPNLQISDVRAIAEDSLGRIYLGLNGDGLLRGSPASWDQFRARDGLAGDHIWALHVDREDTIWIGSHGRGLSRFKGGRFFNFEGKLELPRLINGIIEDDTGHLWCSSNQGLFRANRSQLNALAESRASSVEVTHYSRADGMGSGQCTGRAWKARDGRLWFTTMGGVTVVDPHNLPSNPRPPPIVVEQVLIDDQPVSAAANIKVPAGASRLEFRYAGLSFSVPERVRFQYRLTGFDADWVKAHNRRVAYYTKVPPGSYRFEVIACNNDNVWSIVPAAVSLVVAPRFWQTEWFLFAVVMAAGGCVVGAFKLRIVQLKRERLRQENFSRRLIESQENERKRIAAELHDSLGQNLLVVKNYAAMGMRDGTPPGKMREQLEEISQSAIASIEEVRSIARALRPYQLDRFGLTKTLEDAADLVAKAGTLNIQTEIDNVDEAFTPEAQISIFRIVQEWLNNVVKHAQAQTARLIVTKEDGTVRMILEDDGKGFDYAAVTNRNGRSGTFGLANLRERASLLGGSVRIETAPGKGTRLRVELPLLKNGIHKSTTTMPETM
jgi:signal transduction histidine kinase